VRYLLDTHVVLWMLDDAPQLGSKVRDELTDPANDVYVSIWEMALKGRIGKLQTDIAEVIGYLARTGCGCSTCVPVIYCNSLRCPFCQATETRPTTS
jgi:hypothetical protein